MDDPRDDSVEARLGRIEEAVNDIGETTVVLFIMAAAAVVGLIIGAVILLIRIWFHG